MPTNIKYIYRTLFLRCLLRKLYLPVNKLFYYMLYFGNGLIAFCIHHKFLVSTQFNLTCKSAAKSRKFSRNVYVQHSSTFCCVLARYFPDVSQVFRGATHHENRLGTDFLLRSNIDVVRYDGSVCSFSNVEN